MNGKTLNAGQICLAPDYVFVPEDKAGEFVAEAKASVARMFPTLKDNPDYTSVIKTFDPVPLRQTQPFKHNKKNSAELWVVFLLREHFRSLSIGKDRYWPLVAGLCAAAGITNPNGQIYGPDELKSWWQKNWPRTYTQLEPTQAGPDLSGAAYQQDFDWFVSWIEWQRKRTSF